MDFLTNHIDSYSRNDAGLIQHRKSQAKVVDALMNQCQAFVAAIRKQQPPVVSALDGALALKVTEMIREKIVERAAWRISSFHQDYIEGSGLQKEN